MKRLLAFLFVSALLIGLPMFAGRDVLQNEHISKAIIVCKEDIEFDDSLKIISGEQFYYTLLENFSEQAKKFKNIDGIVLYFYDYSFKNIVKDFNIDFFEGQPAGEYQISYGYTNFFKDFVYVNNKQVNVQIAQKDNEVIVGFPAILTGF